MRLSLQSQRHKLNYKVGISSCQLLDHLTEQEVLQIFSLPDLQYCHYHLQDLSYLIVQHQQNYGVDLKSSSHKTQFVFACSNYQHNIDKDRTPPLVSMYLAVKLFHLTSDHWPH